MSRADITLNKKLALETSLNRKIRRVFSAINNNSSKPFFNPAVYEPQLREVIRSHYELVYSNFYKDYRQEHKIEMQEMQRLMMDAAAKAKFDYRSEVQAGIITKTNSVQLDKAKTKAGDIAKESNRPFRTILPGIYGTLLYARIDAICNTETQWCAEWTRATEVDYLLFNEGLSVKAKSNSNKRWDAVGDDRMRPWHSDADSQVVKADDTFTVGGELLMFPGDTSYGATAKNIINCRCSVTYGINAASLTEVIRAPDLEAAPTIPPKPDKVRRVGNRIQKSISQAIKDGDSAILAELEQLDDDYKLLKMRWEDGEEVFNADFHKIDLRLKDIRKRQGIKGATKVVKKKAAKKKAAKKKIKDDTPPRPNRRTTGNQVGWREDVDEFVEAAEDHLAKNDFTATFIEDYLAEESTTARIQMLEDLRDHIKVNNKASGLRGSPNIRGKGRGKTVDDRVNAVHKEIFKDGLLNDELVQDIHGTIEATIENSINHRAYASSWRNEVSFKRNERVPVIAHEFGHHIEFRNPEVHKMLIRWREKRALKAKDLGKPVFKNYHGELGIPDEFWNPYVGRVYSAKGDAHATMNVLLNTNSTEVLSMGMQTLYDPSDMAAMLKKDPEHFKLIYGILVGV